jgi:hypothetical protein
MSKSYSVNVRSLYRSGSLKTESGELAKYKLDLVGVQEVRWDKGGTEPAGDYTFFYGNGNADHHLGTGLGQGRVASSCEHGYEPSGSIKCGEFLD